MKKLAIEILRFFGYSIKKIPSRTILKKDSEIRVGKFKLTSPSINPLIHTYSENADFANEISRITIQVLTKYPDLHFIDVGANIGDTAAIIKSIADIPITCVEGDPFTFKYLNKNKLQFKNIQTINQYLGEVDEDKPILTEKSGWNTTLIPNESGQKINLKSLDSIISQISEPDTNYKILKIDTEGFDTIIIRGAWATIQKYNPIIYLEFNRDNMAAINETGIDTLLKLNSLDYEKALFYDDKGRFILSANLTDLKLIADLNNYSDGKKGLIYYYNICLFHKKDIDLATLISEKERAINMNK